MFINNLCPKNNATKTWAFAKASINGKRAQELNGSPNNPETNQTVTSAKEKERIFSIQYDNQTDYIPDDPKLELNITRGRESNEPNTLTSQITGNEWERATRQLNSNSMGNDLIHNQMITILTETNKIHLLHLFNHMLQTHYVSLYWKTATIMHKPDKPAEKLESYRPISITS